MVEYKMIKEKFISIPEAKEILSGIEEPEYEQKLAAEHVKKSAKMKKEEADKLAEELKAMDNRKMKEEYIMKIIDLAPKDLDDLKVILSGSPVAFKDEEIIAFLDIIKKHVK